VLSKGTICTSIRIDNVLGTATPILISKSSGPGIGRSGRDSLRHCLGVGRRQSQVPPWPETPPRQEPPFAPDRLMTHARIVLMIDLHARRVIEFPLATAGFNAGHKLSDAFLSNLESLRDSPASA
jgi:hypothetical protein